MIWWVLGPLAFVAVIVVVISVHEFGHFVFGKVFGIRVDEFAIGFGPRVISRQWGETVYAIRAIPLGGFVRMAGMIGHESEADAGERNFYRASIPKRLITLLAGVTFNVILGGILFTVVAMLPRPWSYTPGAPAMQGGLHD